MKIASQILKKKLLSVLIQVFFYSHYVGIIFLAFALSRRNRSSHQRCSIEKPVLKNFVIFTGKQLYWSLFLVKLQA